MKSMLKGLIFLVVLGAAGGAGFYHWRVQRLRSQRPVYTRIPVERGSVLVTVQATGAVQPENRLVIRPPIGGRIDQVQVAEGDHVHKGETLALMSSTDRAALLDVARSKGPAEIRHWEEIYRATPIIAPMDGVIISRDVEPGQTISTTDSVMVLSDHLIVVAQVDETDMAKVALGEPAEITLDAYPDRKIEGHVHQIAFEARTVNNVTIYDVQVSPDQVPPFMRSGMTASVAFQVAERHDVLVVPVSALHQDGSRTTVLVRRPRQDAAAAASADTADASDLHAGPGGRPAAVEIQTGLTDGKVVEVVSGLSEGETVLQEAMRLPQAKSGGSNPFSPMGRRGGRHK